MAASDGRRVSVALLGNPNTGKTTLFNRLCGARAKTSNFPGTTTEMRMGRSTADFDVIDLPGLYSLDGPSPEATIVRDFLQGPVDNRPDAVIAIVDAANLARNLVLVGEVLTFDEPVIVALNMVDLAERLGQRLDIGALSRRLGVPVIPMVASKGVGLDALRAAIGALPGPGVQVRPADLPAAEPEGPASIEAFTAWADGVLAEAYPGGAPAVAMDVRTERVDRILTHPVSGTLVFLGVMGALFWTLFELATIPMDLIELTFASLGSGVSAVVPEGPVRDLLIDGVIGGIAGTVVFLPQICMLFFMISLLEDTGYLARAAFVNDRFFRRFGLPGHAFVPLLTAHACALPGIMSTRLIPDRRDRLATILVAPFMSCSARLPVYVLLTTLLFADRPGMAGLAFAGCYLLGSGAAFFSAWLFSRAGLPGRPRPMVLELPSFKRPSLTNALFTARDQGLAFLQTAGTVIVAICVVMWWLSAYPKVEPTAEIVAMRTAGLEAEADLLQARAEQAGSFAGRMGQAIQPVFAPLGYDWQLTVGVLTSFLAREVFVSTMSVLVGGGAEAEPDEGIMDRIRAMTRADGSLVFTPATAASALVFFVLAMQCLPTLAVTRKETGRIKYAAIQLAYMSSLAYVTALVVYQGLRAFGVS